MPTGSQCVSQRSFRETTPSEKMGGRDKKEYLPPTEKPICAHEEVNVCHKEIS